MNHLLLRSLKTVGDSRSIWVCRAQVRASSSLWEVELWPQSDQHSAGTSLQSGLFELQICSVKNRACLWNAVIVLLNSLRRPMCSSCSVGVPGKVYGAVAGAAPGVRAGESGRARWRVLTTVSINLDVQKQLVFLHTPKNNERQSMSGQLFGWYLANLGLIAQV